MQVWRNLRHRHRVGKAVKIVRLKADSFYANFTYVTFQKVPIPHLTHTLAKTGLFKNFLYQVGVKSTVFWVFEDLKFKISQGLEQN